MLTDGNTLPMDIPDLVQQALGDEEIQAGVSLGDDDAVCLTPTRTLVYDGEGLLSDEQVSEYSHDVEQIYRKQGRRKTKFVLEYIDGTRSFTVPSNRGENVLEMLLQGVLRLEGVVDPRESLVGVYLFSELTLVISEGRLIKHIGEAVWNEDYESHSFDDVTGLEFERGSVATSVVLSIDGRPQRVKVPNDKARFVQQDLEKALFAYYDVSSLEELNRAVDDGSGADSGTGAGGGDDDGEEFAFGDGIDPLVTDHEDDVQEPIGEGNEDVMATDALTEGGADAASAGSADPGSNATDDSGDAVDADGAGSSAETETGSTLDDNDAGEGDSDAAAVGGAGDAGDDGTGPAESGIAGDDVDAQADLFTSKAAESTETSDGSAAGSAGPPESGVASGTATEPATDASDDGEAVSGEELELVADRLEELTDAVDRQNELLKRQHSAIKQLAERIQSE